MSRSEPLPKSVDIFGHIYGVEPGDSEIAKGGGGCCVPFEQVIRICDAHPERMMEVFLHECVEAANEIMNLGMDHHQITVMGNLMYQMEKR